MIPGNVESGAGPFEGRPSPLNCRFRTVSGGSCSRLAPRLAASWATDRGFLPAHRVFRPGSGRAELCRMSFANTSLMVLLINQPLPPWSPQGGGTAALGLPYHSLFTGSYANPPSIAVRRSLPRTGRDTLTVRLRNGNAGAGRRKTHCAQGRTAQRETLDWGWRKTQLRQAVMSDEQLRGEVRRRRSPASGTCA